MTVMYNGMTWDILAASRTTRTLNLRRRLGNGASQQITINPSLPEISRVFSIDSQYQHVLERDYGIKFRDSFLDDPVIDTEVK